jgi:hypothetical protein
MPSLQRIDGWMTTPRNLRSTVILILRRARTGRWERILTGRAKMICKEKFYSASTVLMAKNWEECAMLAPSRISPPTNELGSSCEDPE